MIEKKDIPIISENDEAAARESSDESFDWILRMKFSLPLFLRR